MVSWFYYYGVSMNITPIFREDPHMQFLWYVLFTAAVVAADQWTKYLTVVNIPLYQDVEFLPGFLGLTYVQTGKDLRPVRQIIVTGGSLIHTKRTGEIASHALYNPAEPMSLRPLKAQVLVDRSYILAAMGLLAEYEPKVALHIMKKELIPDGYQE